uniref:NADH-ubiquinone oxidoreductase chain 4L n=1 Tax=Phyllotreta variipennis TaxID=1425530 RepID=A0A1P8NMC4_9CUCU|nr:NADH dehydrogenase subunit 4L [Phyllotreta variipennis]
MWVLTLLIFLLNHKHFLLMLLILEFMVLILYLGLTVALNFMIYEYYFMLIFLSMSVCEGVLGLVILILMVRVHSNDYILTFSSLW